MIKFCCNPKKINQSEFFKPLVRRVYWEKISNYWKLPLEIKKAITAVYTLGSNILYEQPTVYSGLAHQAPTSPRCPYAFARAVPIRVGRTAGGDHGFTRVSGIGLRWLSTAQNTLSAVASSSYRTWRAPAQHSSPVPKNSLCYSIITFMSFCWVLF